MELPFLLLNDCPKKLFTLTRSPSTALRRGPHFLAPRDFGCFPPAKRFQTNGNVKSQGRANKSRFSKKCVYQNLRLQILKAISLHVPTKSPLFWCEVITPHSSYSFRASKPYFPYFRASSLRRFNTSSLGGSIKRRCRAFSVLLWHVNSLVKFATNLQKCTYISNASPSCNASNTQRK